MSETKPFGVSKALLRRAWQRVKANEGAAGVDAQTIEEFASDEKNNLYQIWNRMSLAFREDECRVREGDGAENLSVLRRMALNLLKREKAHKGGIEAKRCRAGWDVGYMETVLAGLHA